MFEEYLRCWNLAPDGEPLQTLNSDLLPVACEGAPAMLKLARELEEERGNALMEWWDGRGSAPVLARKGPALLMARAQGDRSLTHMALAGDDDAVTRILCRVAIRLHACPGEPPFKLVRLADWFAPLTAGGGHGNAVIDLAAATARELLGGQTELAVLHGDVHHANVLDFGGGEWLAIDPKGLFGERTFDFVNMLRNPDPELANEPGRVERQAALIAIEAKLDDKRLLRWLLAFSGLSAVWLIEDGDEPAADIRMAGIAAARLQLSV